MIDFKVSKADALAIHRIVRRAGFLAEDFGLDFDALTLDMDLTACHNNGCPLDLDGLENADNFNFCHDVFGIRKHINRDTGMLMDCFVPRFAKSNQTP